MPFAKLESAPDLVIRWSLTASAERIWRHLMKPERLPDWLGRVVDSTGQDELLLIDHGDGYICESRILLTDATARHLQFTWKFPDEHETLVTVQVLAQESGTSLVLRHAGLGDLQESYEPGWVTHLTYLEASLDNSPLPADEFWNLYGTFSRILSRS